MVGLALPPMASSAVAAQVATCTLFR